MLNGMHKLFPRNIGVGKLDHSLLKTLNHKAEKLLKGGKGEDMSAQLAGRLTQQIKFPLTDPAGAELAQTEFATGCGVWIEESKRDWDRAATEFWAEGSYAVEVYELWLNCQREGDYNPVHVHGGDFSGVLYLRVPDQVDGSDYGGSICFHGPEAYDPTRFRMGMVQYFMPVPGTYYVFPAWQPHSVMPFKGPGERWSIAFNARIHRV